MAPTIRFQALTQPDGQGSTVRSGQQGFALLETLIAIVVLMIGLLAVLATFALAVGNTTSVQYDSVARQKAAEAMESIFTARQTSQLSFDRIQNVGSGTGFAAGDLIYLMNSDQFWTISVASASATTIVVPSPGVPVALPQGVQVGRPKQIRYLWDGINTVFKDAGTGLGFQPLANGVTGFQLTYFDSNDVAIPVASLGASLDLIRRVLVTLTARSAGTDEVRSFTLTSSVRPRNL